MEIKTIDGDSVISDSNYASDEGFYGYMNRTQDYVFDITAGGGARG